VGITTQIAAPTKAESPLALWHLLSLDAPTVAALWVWFIARSSHISLPLAVPAAMAIAVWILYVVDRLLDARGLETGRAGLDDLEARHAFHYRHRRLFRVGIALAAVGLAVLLPRLDARSMRLYLIEGGLLLVWFAILHATLSAHRLPKEMAVGLFFSAAIFIPTVAREPGLWASLLPAALLVGVLCSLNCLFIYAWEHASDFHRTGRLAHPTTRFAVTHLYALTIAAVVGAFLIAIFGSALAKPAAAAFALSAGGLLALHCIRRRFSRNDLRAAADLALLTPILLLPFLR
jgi:hypothetical protein